jgi:hypothetical protein
MSKNKIGISILLLAMIAGIMLVPAVNAQQEDNFFDDGSDLPDYDPSIFEKLKDDSDVIETRGVILNITDDKEKVKWLDTLEMCIENSTDELDPYMMENGGPLIGFGHHVDGYILVVFNEKLSNSINDSTMDEMYTIISNNGKKVGLSNVPVVFKTGNIPQITSRTSTWTNLIGGIKLRSGNAYSTLSFAAEDSSGTTGFVMSGHAAESVGVGGSIYQPDTSRLVGSVEDIGGNYADAAWVEATNVEAKVYHQDTDVTKDVTDSGEPSKHLTVYMSGVTSGKQRGSVKILYREITHPIYGSLDDQCAATYDSAAGDSGAPVYKLTATGVKIVGVHWGRNGDYAYFSPISGVSNDLGVEPLET